MVRDRVAEFGRVGKNSKTLEGLPMSEELLTKARIYLDQNVVSDLADGKISIDFPDGAIIVYSKETLAEIHRSNQPEKFIDALQKLNALQIEPYVKDFKVTDECWLSFETSVERNYQAYLAAIEGFEGVENVFDGLLAWLNGGESFAELEKLPANLEQALDSLPGMDEQQKAKLSQVDDKGWDDIVERMKTHGNDINNTRNAFGLEKGAASNFSPEEVFEGVWSLIPKDAKKHFTLNQLFGFEPYDYEASDVIATRHESIARCCAVFDILGYEAEKKSRKKRFIPNVRSDSTHIAMASYCACLITGDKKLINRSRAIYSKLGYFVNMQLYQPFES